MKSNAMYRKARVICTKPEDKKWSDIPSSGQTYCSSLNSSSTPVNIQTQLNAFQRSSTPNSTRPAEKNSHDSSLH